MNKEKNEPKLRFPEFKDDGEWQEKELIDICTMKAGSFVQASQIIEQEAGNLFPCYGGNGLRGYTKSFTHDGNYPLIGRQGALCGNVTFVTNKFHATEHAVVTTPNSNIDVKWLFYSLVRANLNQYATGQAQPGLSVSNLNKVKLVVPKQKKEQKKVADCLSSLDNLIGAETEKLDLLKEHKKGLLQKLFPAEGQTTPEFRFPEFENNGEWEEKTLGECVEICGRIGYRGYTLKDIVNKGEGAIAMSPSNIDEAGVLSFNKTTYISWFKYDESPEIMLKDGYTVLVKTGSSYGKSALIRRLPEKSTINPQLVVLKPTKIYDKFLSLLVSHETVQKQISSTIVGGAIPTLSQTSLSKFKIAIPKPEEQKKIANCIFSLDDLIEMQSNSIENLKAHKKGLMQQLFPNI